jgi:plastocyanin
MSEQSAIAECSQGAINQAGHALRSLTATPAPGRAMSIESRASILGCLYLAAVLTYYFLKFYPTPWTVGILPFDVVFALAAVGVWKRPKAGFIAALSISGVSLILVGPSLGIGEALTLPGLLAGGATANGFFFVTLFFSLFGAREAWARRDAAEARAFRLGRTAGIGASIFLLSLVALGVVYGSTQATAVTTAQTEVIIAPGAGYLTGDKFFVPQTLQVKVGQTVTWKNLDSTNHTVTSNTGLFRSGDIGVGAAYSYTFEQPGTYTYTCDYHVWMTGVIVVVNG